MEYSFIDETLKDFLRYKNGSVIIIFADTFEEAENWLLNMVGQIQVLSIIFGGK